MSIYNKAFSEKQFYHTGLLAVIVIAIVVVFPLFTTGYTTHDDTRTGLSSYLNIRYEQALNKAAEVGRVSVLMGYCLYGSKYSPIVLPYLIDSVWYYKSVALGAIALNIALFAYALYQIIPQRLFSVFFVIFFLTTLQGSWEHNLITSYPFVFCLEISELLLCFIFLLKYLKSQNKYYWVISIILTGVLFFTSPDFREFNILYFIVFFCVIYFNLRQTIREQQVAISKALRIFSPYLLIIAIYLCIYFTFRYYHPSIYVGNQAAFSSPISCLKVLYQYTIASFPTYIYFHYGFLFDTYSDLVQGHNIIFGVVNNLKPEWLIKSVVASYFVYSLLFNNLLSFSRKKILSLSVTSICLILFPIILLSVVPKYQKWIEVGSLSYAYGYHVFFGVVLLIITVIVFINGILPKNNARFGYVVILAMCVGLMSILTDYANYYVAKSQTQSQKKWKIFDAFVDAVDLPDNSFVYAPSLWQHIGIVANDPTYWTDYYRLKKRPDNKNVVFSNDLEQLNKRFSNSGAGDLFYLKYSQEPKDPNQFILFAGMQDLRFDEDRAVPYASKTVLITDSKYRKFTVFGNRFTDSLDTTNPRSVLFSQLVDMSKIKGKDYIKIEMSDSGLMDLESLSVSNYLDHKISHRHLGKEAIIILPGAGFYAWEPSSDAALAERWIWSSGNAEFIIHNFSTSVIQRMLSLSLDTLLPREVEIHIDGVNTDHAYQLRPEHTTPVLLEIVLKPGKNVISIHTNEPAKQPINGDCRNLAFKVNVMEIK